MEQKRILIVDDERIILESLRAELTDLGFFVETAETGEDGLRKLEEKEYNLLISDLIMEGIGGIELLKEAGRINPLMSVCLLTGHTDLTSAIEVLRLGADEYLIKPCYGEELHLRVQRALDREEMRRKIKYYENILSVCAVCKKIRDDSGKEPGQGNWIEMEDYLRKKTGVEMQHGCCEICAGKIEKKSTGNR